EDSPQRQVRKEKGLLRWGLKKGVGHPAAIAAAGRPGCSAPATLAPAAGRFPRTIPRELAGKYLFGRRPEAAPHAFGSGRQPRRPGGCGADRPPRDLPQEILEPLADAEVPRVVDRGLRAQRAALLVVLLDARAVVVDGRVFCAHHRFEGLAEAVRAVNGTIGQCGRPVTGQSPLASVEAVAQRLQALLADPDQPALRSVEVD